MHLKMEHQNRLDDVLFEGSLFVHLLKQSKPIKLEANSASDTTSQYGSRIKNMNTLNKRLRQDVLAKNGKKPVTPKNKVEKFLLDLSIHQQDVLDIERLLPVVQNSLNASRTATVAKAPHTQSAGGSPTKMERSASISSFGAIQPGQNAQTSLGTRIAPAIGRVSLATI